MSNPDSATTLPFTHPNQEFMAKTTDRLFEFFEVAAPWHRCLWGVGIVLGLRELVEYSRIQREGGLDSAGVKYVASALVRDVTEDPGSKPFAEPIRDVLQRAANLEARKGLKEVDEDRLTHLANRVEDGYLSRVRDAYLSASHPGVERSARIIGSHLLDIGFSPDQLHRWLTSDTKSHAQYDLVRLIDSAIGMSQRSSERIYKVLVPCSCPDVKKDLPRGIEWLEPPAVLELIEREVDPNLRPRVEGAFVFEVEALDPWAAVDLADELITRMASRITVGRAGGASLRPSGTAYILGKSREYKLSRPGRQLEIHALSRLDAIFGMDDDYFQLDDAIELASYLEVGSSGAAVTGGWAAIEGLLIYPGVEQHHLAADRLARIVACSLTRAEMTSLAYQYRDEGSGELAESLRALTEDVPNYQRVALIEEHLRRGNELKFLRPRDQAATDRLLAIIADPATELGRISKYIEQTFRRLYNQRNLIMHSGSFRSIALAATLRTAPALVGAGLDRISHAQLRRSNPLRPLELAARAEMELSMLGRDGASLVIDLLGD
ncbi:MAG: hypothetical protein ACYCPT_10490 [Acidimicrobiales bacterium]